jgi:glycosyltransferase involved in cell wall biosynthesis
LLKHIDCVKYDVNLICDLNGPYEPRPEVTVVNLNPSASATASSTFVERKPPKRITVLLGSKLRSFAGTEARVILGFHRDARRLSKLLKPLQLDLFHTQNTGCEEAPYAAKLAGVPHIVGTFHTDWTTDLHNARGGPGYRMLERISNHSLHRAIAVSDATGRNWRTRTGLPPQRVVTIHNGIDIDAFTRKISKAVAKARFAIPESRTVIVAVGRLDEVKGYDTLLHAVAEARRRVPRVHVLFAGDGPLRQALEFQAFQLGLAEQVSFAGFVNDVTTALDAADMLALPSRTEACPYAVLEAMAAGLPVVASRVGGVPELVVHTGTGLLAEPRGVTAFATAIAHLANHTEQSALYGAAGRERAKAHFREDVMATRTFALYDELLASRRFMESRS